MHHAAEFILHSCCERNLESEWHISTLQSYQYQLDLISASTDTNYPHWNCCNIFCKLHTQSYAICLKLKSFMLQNSSSISEYLEYAWRRVLWELSLSAYIIAQSWNRHNCCCSIVLKCQRLALGSQSMKAWVNHEIIWEIFPSCCQQKTESLIVGRLKAIGRYQTQICRPPVQQAWLWCCDDSIFDKHRQSWTLIRHSQIPGCSKNTQPHFIPWGVAWRGMHLCCTSNISTAL